MAYEYIDTCNIPTDPTTCTIIFLGYLKEVDVKYWWPFNSFCLE